MKYPASTATRIPAPTQSSREKDDVDEGFASGSTVPSFPISEKGESRDPVPSPRDGAALFFLDRGRPIPPCD
jgi:hypothetical protein